MLSFASDYTEGAHPQVLKRLCETNLEQLSGYGTDPYCESAKQKIKAAIAKPDADVFLLTGGTQTNQIVIDTVLGACEGVICADTGHIACHEAGAIEYTGRKVLPVAQTEGKIAAETVEAYLQTFYADDNHDHMVFPGMVYISHPTEYGTLYSLAELTALAAVCHRYEIPLYLDGARLGYGLMSAGTDVTIADVAELCDVFYIGGTKVGALCGEAVVFPRGNAPKRFFTSIKQHGALLAKGRLLGVQFDALFTDGLYFAASRHAIEQSDKLRKLFAERNYQFFIETVTNQVFIVLENRKMEELARSVSFSFWERIDADHTVVRFATSWATTDEQLAALESLL